MAMAAFQRIDQRQACATALGILVPPGQRTTVIVRPRALSWDLLPVQIRDGVRSAFCQFSRDEAAGVARRLHRDLASDHAEDPLVILSNSARDGFHVAVRASGFYWLACARAPGQSYQPISFSTETDAELAAQQLAEFVCPKSDANQQVYFNTQHFGE